MNMFTEEEEILEKIKQLLETDELQKLKSKDQLHDFTESYYRLLRQIKKLVKISDNQQKLINENNEILTRLTTDLTNEQNLSQELLLNILPKKVAKELKVKGKAEPIFYDQVTVLFTDFKGFTKSSEVLTPSELVTELDEYFSFFDETMNLFHLEKLKTIGDSYMCAGGIPVKNQSHAVDCTLAALHLQKFMTKQSTKKNQEGKEAWEIRLGIHTGPVIAGVVGKKKFAYDIWGDTVNVASRMESSGEPNKVNISKDTYEIIKDFFDCTPRGKIGAKNKGDIEMYFVENIKKDLIDKEGKLNNKFSLMYNLLKEGEIVEEAPFVERRKNLPDTRNNPTERRKNLINFLSA